MKKIGSTLAFLGIVAIILNFINFVPRVLSWIYLWGETTAWIIKLSITGIGIVLYLLGKDEVSEEQIEDDNDKTIP